MQLTLVRISEREAENCSSMLAMNFAMSRNWGGNPMLVMECILCISLKTAKPLQKDTTLKCWLGRNRRRHPIRNLKFRFRLKASQSGC